MISTGKLNQIFPDWRKKKWLLQLECDTDITEEYERLKDKVVSIEIKLFREKRSRDANAYYWKLVDMIADAKKLKSSVVHNMMLRDYGTLEPDWYTVVPDTDADEERVLASQFYHLKPTTEVKVGRDGNAWRTYLVIKGSSEYDTKEMSRLIDGTVQEAKQLGIETLPPAEIERLKEEWRAKNE